MPTPISLSTQSPVPSTRQTTYPSAPLTATIDTFDSPPPFRKQIILKHSPIHISSRGHRSSDLSRARKPLSRTKCFYFGDVGVDGFRSLKASWLSENISTYTAPYDSFPHLDPEFRSHIFAEGAWSVSLPALPRMRYQVTMGFAEVYPAACRSRRKSRYRVFRVKILRTSRLVDVMKRKGCATPLIMHFNNVTVGDGMKAIVVTLEAITGNAMLSTLCYERILETPSPSPNHKNSGPRERWNGVPSPQVSSDEKVAIVTPGTAYSCINFGPQRVGGYRLFDKTAMSGDAHLRKENSSPHPHLTKAYMSSVFGHVWSYDLKLPTTAMHSVVLGFAETSQKVCGIAAKENNNTRRVFSVRVAGEARILNVKKTIGCFKPFQTFFSNVSSSDYTVTVELESISEKAMLSVVCYSKEPVGAEPFITIDASPSNRPPLITNSQSPPTTPEPTPATLGDEAFECFGFGSSSAPGFRKVTRTSISDDLMYYTDPTVNISPPSLVKNVYKSHLYGAKFRVAISSNSTTPKSVILGFAEIFANNCEEEARIFKFRTATSSRIIDLYEEVGCYSSFNVRIDGIPSAPDGSIEVIFTTFKDNAMISALCVQDDVSQVGLRQSIVDGFPEAPSGRQIVSTPVRRQFAVEVGSMPNLMITPSPSLIPVIIGGGGDETTGGDASVAPSAAPSTTIPSPSEQIATSVTVIPSKKPSPSVQLSIEASPSDGGESSTLSPSLFNSPSPPVIIGIPSPIGSVSLSVAPSQDPAPAVSPSTSPISVTIGVASVRPSYAPTPDGIPSPSSSTIIVNSEGPSSSPSNALIPSASVSPVSPSPSIFIVGDEGGESQIPSATRSQNVITAKPSTSLPPVQPSSETAPSFSAFVSPSASNIPTPSAVRSIEVSPKSSASSPPSQTVTIPTSTSKVSNSPASETPQASIRADPTNIVVPVSATPSSLPLTPGPLDPPDPPVSPSNPSATTGASPSTFLIQSPTTIPLSPDPTILAIPSPSNPIVALLTISPVTSPFPSEVIILPTPTHSPVSSPPSSPSAKMSPLENMDPSMSPLTSMDAASSPSESSPVKSPSFDAVPSPSESFPAIFPPSTEPSPYPSIPYPSPTITIGPDEILSSPSMAPSAAPVTSNGPDSEKDGLAAVSPDLDESLDPSGEPPYGIVPIPNTDDAGIVQGPDGSSNTTLSDTEGQPPSIVAEGQWRDLMGTGPSSRLFSIAMGIIGTLLVLALLYCLFMTIFKGGPPSYSYASQYSPTGTNDRGGVGSPPATATGYGAPLAGASADVYGTDGGRDGVPTSITGMAGGPDPVDAVMQGEAVDFERPDAGSLGGDGNVTFAMAPTGFSSFRECGPPTGNEEQNLDMNITGAMTGYENPYFRESNPGDAHAYGGADDISFTPEPDTHSAGYGSNFGVDQEESSIGEEGTDNYSRAPSMDEESTGIGTEIAKESFDNVEDEDEYEPEDSESGFDMGSVGVGDGGITMGSTTEDDWEQRIMAHEGRIAEQMEKENSFDEIGRVITKSMKANATDGGAVSQNSEGIVALDAVERSQDREESMGESRVASQAYATSSGMGGSTSGGEEYLSNGSRPAATPYEQDMSLGEEGIEEELDYGSRTGHRRQSARMSRRFVVDRTRIGRQSQFEDGSSEGPWPTWWTQSKERELVDNGIVGQTGTDAKDADGGKENDSWPSNYDGGENPNRMSEHMDGMGKGQAGLVETGRLLGDSEWRRDSAQAGGKKAHELDPEYEYLRKRREPYVKVVANRLSTGVPRQTSEELED